MVNKIENGIEHPVPHKIKPNIVMLVQSIPRADIAEMVRGKAIYSGFAFPRYGVTPGSFAPRDMIPSLSTLDENWFNIGSTRYHKKQ